MPKTLKPKIKKLEIKIKEALKMDHPIKTEITPLALSLEFGRHDLNDAVGKLQEKINEIIRRIN
jgi:hypothetical protein